MTSQISIVDIAYQIIDMHEENQRLRRDLEHYKPYEQMYFDTLNDSIAHSQSMIGTILVAALDPDSVINEGHRAIEAKRLKNTN